MCVAVIRKIWDSCLKEIDDNKFSLNIVGDGLLEKLKNLIRNLVLNQNFKFIRSY